MIPSSTKKKTGVVRLPTIKPHPFVRDFHFEFPSSWHCTPSCLVSRQSGAVFHPGPSPVVSAKAGLPLNLSLNPGIAFARSDFSDIAPSVTSFGPIFLLLPPRLSCGHRLHGYAPQHRTAAGSGVLPPATASSIAHALNNLPPVSPTVVADWSATSSLGSGE